MIPQGTTKYSPITISKYDFADWFESMCLERDWCKYAITIIHRNADTPWAATISLNRFVPKVFSKTISPNWHRPNFIDNIRLVTFLDPPGSKYRNHANPYELASAQDSYHHHGVLFLAPSLQERFEMNARFLIDDIDQACCSEGYSSEFERTMAEGSKSYLRKLQADLGHTFVSFRGSTVRACFIKRVYYLDDWSTYAAKTIRPMLHQYPDSAYAIFPKWSTPVASM
jgi:hypothetical protein